LVYNVKMPISADYLICGAPRMLFTAEEMREILTGSTAA
jgi:hypothetical protein